MTLDMPGEYAIAAFSGVRGDMKARHQTTGSNDFVWGFVSLLQALSPACVETQALSANLDRLPSARSAVPRTGNSCCGPAQSTLGSQSIPTTEDNHK